MQSHGGALGVNGAKETLCWLLISGRYTLQINIYIFISELSAPSYLQIMFIFLCLRSPDFFLLPVG